MKAILEFNLPEENEQFLAATHGMDWVLTVFDLDREMRIKIRHGHELKSADEALQYIRAFLHETLNDRNLTLDMIP